jgi:hypothetical protein
MLFDISPHISIFSHDLLSFDFLDFSIFFDLIVLWRCLLAIEDDGEIAWFWIGSHAEYDQLLRGG